MINEFARFSTRSENVYFANNEQALIAVFTDVFCFTHVEHPLIKLKLYNNWSAQAVNSLLKFKATNQVCSSLKISQSINPESACDRNKKSMYSCFYESKKFLSCLMYWEVKKQMIVKIYIFKALAKIFLLRWKRCSWLTFNQMDFMKR